MFCVPLGFLILLSVTLLAACGDSGGDEEVTLCDDESCCDDGEVWTNDEGGWQCVEEGTPIVYEQVLETYPAFQRDILVVVDNGPGACQEQELASDYLAELNDVIWDNYPGVGLRFLFAAMDPTSAETFGQQLLHPGIYPADDRWCGDSILGQNCDDLPADGVISPTAYLGLPRSEGRDTMLRHLNCLVAAGSSGGAQRSPFDAAEAALSNREIPFRDDADLGLIFISAYDDCSDGTVPGSPGPVGREIQEGGDPAVVCELARNIEDTCREDFDLYRQELALDGVTRTIEEWCAQGSRAEVEALAPELPVDCPAGGCTNRLRSIAEFDERVIALARERMAVDSNQDIVVEGVVPLDFGQDLIDRESDNAVFCDGRGQRAVRHRAFGDKVSGQMYSGALFCDEDRQAISAEFPLAPQPWPDDRLSICLEKYPPICPPDQSTCINANGEADTCQGGPYLPGTDFEYSFCGELRIEVTLTVPADDGGTVELRLQEGTDYSLNLESPACVSTTGVPIGLRFAQEPPPGSTIRVSTGILAGGI